MYFPLLCSNFRVFFFSWIISLNQVEFYRGERYFWIFFLLPFLRCFHCIAWSIFSSSLLLLFACNSMLHTFFLLLKKIPQYGRASSYFSACSPLFEWNCLDLVWVIMSWIFSLCSSDAFKCSTVVGHSYYFLLWL